MSKSKIEQLRREIRADFELTWGAQRDFGNQLEALQAATRQVIDAMTKQAQQLTLAAEASRRTESRMLQQGQRFDRILEAVADEYVSKSDLSAFEARYEERLSALEERFPA